MKDDKDLPAFSTWPERDKRIWFHGFEAGRESGFVAGYDRAEAEHWRLPDYSTAVKSLIAMGITGIDRGEAAHRREAA